MWNKTNSIWEYNSFKSIASSKFSNNLESNNIFTTDGEDNYGHVYTPCWKFDDVYEYFRLYSGYPLNDPYGFLIRAEFSPVRAAKYFSNIKTVRLATSNTSTVSVDDVTRKPIDNIILATTTNIDGKDLEHGDRVLVKDQYTETLTTYGYTSVGSYTVRILDNVSPFIREYFSEGNEVIFVDGTTKVATGTIINKRIELITGANYLVFDVYEGVPDSALGYEVADPTDGLWTKTWTADVNTIYKYNINVGLIEETDLELEDDAKDAYVWVLDGDNNKDKSFRLDRNSDGTVPYGLLGSTDKYFTEVTPAIIQHKLNYNIDPVSPAYSSNRFKTLILDYDIATKLTAYDSSNLTRKFETGEILSLFGGEDIKFLTSCDTITNILFDVNNTIFSRSAVAPNYTFVGIGLNQSQYRTETGDVVLGNTTDGNIELDNNYFNVIAGDFILLKGYDGTDLVFNATFIAQSTMNSTTGLDTISLWPEIPVEIRTELANSGITFVIENLNVYLTDGPISLNNETFTTNLSGWSQTSDGITWVSGSNRANVTAFGYNSNVLYQSITFESNKLYFTSLDISSDTDIQLLADDGSGDFLTILETIPGGIGTYTTPSNAGYIIPDGTTHIGFRVLAKDASLTATVSYIDNVVISTKTIPNIVSNINRSPLGKYYVASNPSGEILNLSFGYSEEGIFGNEEIEVKTDNGGGFVSALKLKYSADRGSLPETIYSPFYSLGLLLNQIDGGSTFPNNYDFTQSHSDTFTYNNSIVSTRFGIENNKIHIGQLLTDWDYLKPGMFIDVYNTTTSTLIAEDILIIKKEYSSTNDEVIYYTNHVFVSSPSPSDVIQLKLKLKVSELSSNLTSTLKGLSYTIPVQEANAGFIAQSADTLSNITNILYKGFDGYPILLSTLVPGDLSDLRNDFAPIAYYKVGTDIKIQPAKVIADSDWALTDTNKIEIISTSSLNTKIRFIDGLKEIYVSGQVTTDANGNDMTWQQQQYGWILNPGVVVVNAVVGKDSSGNMIWYKGDWRSGVWEDGIWMSGTWRKGIWKGGTWNAYKISDDGNQDVKVIYGDSKETYSIWYSGTWQTGIWNLGAWVSGTWQTGIWNDGIWEDGSWQTGTWNGGTWQAGTWSNGTWNGGDFETGIWTNGIWNQTTSLLSRFGTKATLTDRAYWYAGTWNGGQFHSYMNLVNSLPQASEDHRLSIWFNGTWNAGDWYGGTFIAGTWNEILATKSIWYGGVWLGGWRIDSISEQASTKTFTIDPSQYDSILSISNTQHYLINGQTLCFTGIPDADTTFSNALLANKIVDNGSVSVNGTTVSLTNYPFKKITVINDTDFSIIINQNIGSTTWFNDSQGVTNDSPDGRPICGAIWNGGTWKNGTWLNGIWTKGVFEAGIFANGLFLQGDFGVTYS